MCSMWMFFSPSYDYSTIVLFMCVQSVVFVSGDAEETIVVTIIDDDLPELHETFCVSLILPEGDVEIGDIPEGIYTHSLHNVNLCNSMIYVNQYHMYNGVLLVYSVCDYTSE